MATTFTKSGKGQVEPNHLSAQRTSQIYASLPAKSDITELENGQYVKYDYSAKCVDFAGKGEWMMVFNEVKLYDDRWRESYKDYSMKKADFDDGVMTPRVIKTNIGDIYTTNCIADGDYAVGGKVAPNSNGFLAAAADDSTVVWEIVDITTMADGEPAVKLMRIA